VSCVFSRLKGGLSLPEDDVKASNLDKWTGVQDKINGRVKVCAAFEFCPETGEFPCVANVRTRNGPEVRSRLIWAVASDGVMVKRKTIIVVLVSSG